MGIGDEEKTWREEYDADNKDTGEKIKKRVVSGTGGTRIGAGRVESSVGGVRIGVSSAGINVSGATSGARIGVSSTGMNVSGARSGVGGGGTRIRSDSDWINISGMRISVGGGESSAGGARIGAGSARSGVEGRGMARGHAGHVGLQGRSAVPIPLFLLDEVFIHLDPGDQEAPRCLQPSDNYWTRSLRTEQPLKGPKIRPTFGMAAKDWPRPFPTDRRVTRREVMDAPYLGSLEAWAVQVGLSVGANVDTEARRKRAPELCCTYRDIDSTGLDSLQVTDIATHTVMVR
jgi:hypothetical protein